MNLNHVAEAIKAGGMKGITIFRVSGENGGWMVSVRTEGGFKPFYGYDLTETTERALTNGPQTEPFDDGGLV